jgi:asparagine synthase (glutamine-hydrolysing)
MPRQRATSELQRMLGVVRHESFYAARTLIDEELGLYVGWTAHAGSFSDEDAQRNEADDVTLVFSGEDFSPAGTAQALKARGHVLGGAASAYLVHLYEEGVSFPAALNGLFHGVVADRRKRCVSLFNDRYSMHRLYYHEAKDAFYFAAEAKAILVVRPELRAIDMRGLGESIVLGCVLENRSLFDGIHVLPGGSCWTFEAAHPARKAFYFQPKDWEGQSLLDDGEFYRTTREVFAGVLPRYFGGSDRVGMSLTGGLDSRMIMAWQKQPAESMPCYTWGGTARDCQDVLIAREVARVCRQPHDTITIGETFLTRFSHYADRAVYLTDGCVDAMLAPDVYMNERARALAPVRLTGLYGGEVLRRHLAFKPVFPMPGLFQPELLPRFEDARRTYDAARQGHPLSFAVFRQAPWHHYPSLSLEQTQVTMRTPFLDNEFVKTVYRASESACASSDVSLRLIADGNPALSRFATDRGLGGRGSVAETTSRVLQEFLFKAEYAYDYGMPQWLARIDYRVKALHLERLFLGRHRPHYFRVWYRDQLSAYVREILLDSRSLSRAYVEPRMVEQLVTAHIRGDRNYTTEIHKLLKLELLHRNFIDSQVAARSSEPVAATV